MLNLSKGVGVIKKAKFTEEQIAFVLKQVERGASIEAVCRKAGVSEQTFYRWKTKYSSLLPSEVKRLKQLEEENRILKKLLAWPWTSYQINFIKASGSRPDAH